MQPNIEMLARSATLHAVYETPQTLICISLIFAFSYLYQSDQEIDRTVALVILLVTVTSIIALNSNFYIALTLMIVELGLITALTLLQQAYSGRHLPALCCHRGCYRSSHYFVQCARQNGLQHDSRDDT